MTLLAVALAVAGLAAALLVTARFKSNGEETGLALFIAAGLSSGAFSLALVVCVLRGVHLVAGDDPIFDSDSWTSSALAGAFMGLMIYLLIRVLLVGMFGALFHWSLRIPLDTDATVGQRTRKHIWALSGFVFAFTAVFLIIHPIESETAVLLLLPLFAMFIPFYETLVLPWIEYLKAPRLTTRNLGDIEAWLDEVCADRRIPRFRVRIQEGRLANAFAIGGLIRHLVVIGGGLLDGMSPRHIKAILAHEIAHVARGDVPRLLLPMVVVGGTCYALCVISFSHPLFATEEVASFALGALLAGLFAYVFFMLIPGFFMRRMEFRADRLAVEFLGDGAPLAEALEKLAELNGEPVYLKSWSHPPIQARIDAIRALSR